MSGILQVIVTEARGPVATPANVDNLAVVMGCTSLGSGLSSFFLTPSAAIAARGYGDAVDTLTQIISQKQPGGSPRLPAAIYTTIEDTAGVHGTLDAMNVTGTAVPVVGSSTPLGTYQAAVLVVAGGTIGTTGITYRTRLGQGSAWGALQRLGTLDSIAIANSGVSFVLNPPAAQTTLLIAAVVEARTDTLAHLANVVAHDGADTSSAQVALAASSAPTTGAQAVTVLNLCLAAMKVHTPNITAVHDGQDLANSMAALSACTDQQSAVTLYTAYAGLYNEHLAATFPLSAAGLKAATATVAAPVVLTASDLLAPGLALMLVNPRRLTFLTAGVTPANAPASVDIVGTMNGGAVTETLNLAQTNTSVTSVNAYSTITSLSYPAADGTSATITIGYGQGVHNSADATNVLTATPATHGTLVDGDTWDVGTLAPTPDAAGVAAAFVAMAASPLNNALIVCEFPVDAAMAAVLTTGADVMLATGKRVNIITRTRLPDWEESETEAEWVASVATDYFTFDDSRLHVRATYGLLTDAVNSQVYLRSDLAQFAADLCRTPSSGNARSSYTDAPADRPMANFTLVNSSGVLVGHDEGPLGGATQNTLSNNELGNRFGCNQRVADPVRYGDTFCTFPWVMYASDERIQNLMARRVATAMERVAVTAGTGGLGAALGYTPADGTPGSQDMLSSVAVSSLQSVIFRALSQEFQSDIQNPNDAALDTGLVQVDPVIVVTGGNIAASATVSPLMFGYLVKLTITMAVQQ